MDHRNDAPKPFNRLLAALPDEEFRRLEPALEPVPLTLGHLVYDLGAPIEYAYFPEVGVISVVVVMADGATVEVATVGNEGMVGVPVFLSTRRTVGRAFAQVPGHALRMDAGAFREASRGGALHDVMERYAQALFVQVSQGTACNRVHAIEARCARWLLMTHDRVASSRFPLTQEYLAQMLGVRRASVSEVASALQRRGLIEYTRGVITVVDRPGLEAASCECYAVMRGEFDRLFGAYGVR